MKNKYYIIILFTLIIGMFIFNIVNNNIIATGDRVVAVTTNSTEYDVFDKYLISKLGVKSTPCHIFINDNRVTNVVNGAISESTFNNEIVNQTMKEKLWKKDLKDINGNNINIKDFDMIYLVKTDCQACEDNRETEQFIFNNNSELDILTYYIKSDKKDIDCKGFGCE